MSEIPSLAYEFKPGGHYLVEVKDEAISRDDLLELLETFKKEDINIVFVITKGNEFGIKSIETVEKK